MQDTKKGYRAVLYRVIKWMCIMIFMAAVLLSGNSRASAYAAEDQIKDQSQQRDSDVIRFKNDRVEAGKALEVMNVPEGSSCYWVITGADGEKKSFTTAGNSYTPTEQDREKLITVSIASDQGASASIYFSSLPVIYIQNSAGYYGVGDDYTDAAMQLQGSDKFTEEKELYQGEVKLKLRGNSTKLRSKRPFHLKLDNKSDLLGMGKNKHWALLANDIDHTLMRNKLLYDFSGAIGMQTYMKSENVVLIFNNEYVGVYQLCELVDIGSNRVEVYDWEDKAKTAAKGIAEQLVEEGKIPELDKKQVKDELEDAMCKDLSWITSPYIFTYDADGDNTAETYKITDYTNLSSATGGVLLEMDFFAFEEDNPSTMITAYSQPWYFKTPEYAITNKSLFQYINRYVQSFEYALHSADFIYHEDNVKYNAINRQGGSKNSGYVKSDFTAPEYDGKHYSELFDMDSLVQNFIFCEYAMNWDGMKNSVYMYKDTEGLFHIGPEWDFDWAWGNINMYQKNTWYPELWQTTNNIFTKEQYYQTVQWNRCLIRDPYFLVRAYEKYKEIRDTAIEAMIKDNGTIDTYAKELLIPAAANDEKWGSTYAAYHSVGFEDSVKNMKKFITIRMKWMDQQFTSLDTFIHSLGYYKTDERLKVSTVITKSGTGAAVITAKVTDSDITSVVFQINGTKQYTKKVKSGRAVCTVPASALVKDTKVLNVVQISAKASDGSDILQSEETGNYIQAVSNYAVFHTGTPYNTAHRSYLGIAICLALLISGILLLCFWYNKRSNKKS